jgi:acyl-homoserine lactone synthase
VSDSSGDHLGSARLLPTTRPHILGDLFAGLCAVPPPTGDRISEITRFCLSRRLRARQRLHVRNQLVSALVAHALETGIETYTGVAELGWLQQILSFGWECRPLGPPARFERGMIGALAIAIDRDTPTRLAVNGLWEESEPLARLPQAA